MRLIRYAFLLVIGLALIVLALANRAIVTLNLLPTELSDAFGVSGAVDLPLFAVILLGVLIGLLIGFIWEWLIEFKNRRVIKKTNREKRTLEREVERLKAQSGEGKDDVLALLD